jgi:hypothetical protein
MKLTENTIEVLKNFNSINPAIYIKKGNELATIAVTESIIAHAKVDMEFPTDFGFYDISRFLASVSLFDDPDLKISSNEIVISDGSSSINYRCAREESVTHPHDIEAIEINDVKAHFVLTNDNIQKMFKAVSILTLPKVAIVGDGKQLRIEALDADNRIQDTYSQVIGDTTLEFKAVFNVSDINKIYPTDFDVKVGNSEDGEGLVPFAKLSGVSVDISYLIALSPDSEF